MREGVSGNCKAFATLGNSRADGAFREQLAMREAWCMATRSTAIACERLIAVSYDDSQTELHPISRGTGDFIAIYEITGL
jgi:hypothetical protein